MLSSKFSLKEGKLYEDILIKLLHIRGNYKKTDENQNRLPQIPKMLSVKYSNSCFLFFDAVICCFTGGTLRGNMWIKYEGITTYLPSVFIC